jgi:hypothetical protein
MNQPVPIVSDADVTRVVERDFSRRDHGAALGLLQEYGKQDWHREVPRVRLATLKLAHGNLEKLRAAIKTAVLDYRDVLSYAEYPKYFRDINPAETDEAKLEAAIDADWQQYRQWLEKK